MTNRINELLVENEEQLRYFEGIRRDRKDGASMKKWWQNYLLCFIFYFLLGGLFAGFSMGAWIPDQDTNEKFLAGYAIKPGTSGLKDNFDNNRREKVVEIDLPFGDMGVQTLLADKDLFARVKKEEGSLVAKRENRTVATVAATRAPKIRVQ